MSGKVLKSKLLQTTFYYIDSHTNYASKMNVGPLITKSLSLSLAAVD